MAHPHQPDDEESHCQRRRGVMFRALSTSALALWEEAKRLQPWTQSARLTRDRYASHLHLETDFVIESPTFPKDFDCHFLMSRVLFLRVKNDIEKNVPWFQQRTDARGRVGFSGLQKCTAAILQMNYGNAADSYDEYLHMSERTVRSCIYKFSKAIIFLYHNKYLRKPNANDIQQLYAFHLEKHGFPGMLGNIDCSHWFWVLCPNAWRGQYMRRDHQKPTIAQEAVALQSLWFWHAYFGPSGCNNVLNILEQSPIFDDVVSGNAPNSSFELRGHRYKRWYYLGDEIYPEWSTIMKSLSFPEDVRRTTYKTTHDAAKKDMEHVFGLLKNK